GVAAFPVGRIADRRGPRAVLATTVAIGAVGFVLSARIEALWQLYLSYGVLVGVGMSLIYVLTAATVARWFEARRGLALAIVLSGFNLGWLTGGPLAAWLIGRWGWRTAYVTLGLLVAAVGVPVSLYVRYPRSAEPRRTVADARGAARRRAFADARRWLVVTAWCLLGPLFMMVTVHRVSSARDRGLSLEGAAVALAALGTLRSVVGLGWRSGAGLGPPLGGFVYDATGSYTPSSAFAVLALTAGWVLFRLGSAPRAH